MKENLQREIEIQREEIKDYSEDNNKNDVLELYVK